MKNRTINALPLVAAVLVVLQYVFMPNFREFSALDQNAPTTVFTQVMIFFALILLAWNVAAFFSNAANEKLRRGAPVYSAALFLLLIYDFATIKTGLLPQPFVPWPDAILNAIIRDREILMRSLFHSMQLLFTGYGIGVTAGIITGVAAGWSKAIRYWVQPVIRVLGSIPPVTWLPIILVLASSLFTGAVFLIALAVWHPVTSTTMNGVLSVPKSTFEAARTFGVGRFGMVFKIAIPASTPFIFQGLTQGMSVACTALLVAELMGVEAGLGWYINWQRGWADFAGMYGAILIICITFFMVTTVLDIIRRRVLRWKEGEV